MKGYRIISEDFLNLLNVRNKGGIVNSDGHIWKYDSPKNTLKKSNCVKCFWFFESLEDTIKNYNLIRSFDSIGIAEFDIPKSFIYETGRGCYCGGFLSSYSDDLAVNEFTTLRILPQWLVKVHLMDEIGLAETEDFYGPFSIPIYGITDCLA